MQWFQGVTTVIFLNLYMETSWFQVVFKGVCQRNVLEHDMPWFQRAGPFSTLI